VNCNQARAGLSEELACTVLHGLSDDSRTVISDCQMTVRLTRRRTVISDDFKLGIRVGAGAARAFRVASSSHHDHRRPSESAGESDGRTAGMTDSDSEGIRTGKDRWPG
jgi:hypothetical protein